MGQENKILPFFLLQGTLWEKPFRKERGKRLADVMPSCAFLLGFLEKKEDAREREGVERKGRMAGLCPFIARNVVGGLV